MAGDRLTLRVRDLRVDYEIFADRRAALRKRVVTRTGPGRSLVHALKGVSFDAYEGDCRRSHRLQRFGQVDPSRRGGGTPGPDGRRGARRR